jgi:hypothetical protein
LRNYGVTIRVERVSWASPEAEAAKAEAARRRDFERITQARQRERDAELAEATAIADHEKRKVQIENDRIVSKQERLHRHQLLEMEYQTELLRAKAEMENAQRDAEKAAWEHERTLRNDCEFAKHADEREREGENRHRMVLQELERMRTDLAAIAALPDNLLAQLADRDAKKANAAAERLVSREFDVSPSALARLGYHVDRQSLVQFLREKEVADGKSITVCKAELITRDIGTAKVKALPVNSPLQFEFTTARRGYVSLLNVGTSGTVYLHVPNAYVVLEASRVEAGRVYRVPGPELMPWDRLRHDGLDYIEAGPPGWEHLVAIVSDEPFISAGCLARAHVDPPFVTLSTAEISDLCDALGERGSKSWSAGVLSFLVGEHTREW